MRFRCRKEFRPLEPGSPYEPEDVVPSEAPRFDEGLSALSAATATEVRRGEAKLLVLLVVDPVLVFHDSPGRRNDHHVRVNVSGEGLADRAVAVEANLRYLLRFDDACPAIAGCPHRVGPIVGQDIPFLRHIASLGLQSWIGLDRNRMIWTRKFDLLCFHVLGFLFLLSPSGTA